MAFSFIKKGAESAQLAQKAEAEAELKKSEQGKLWRFYLKQIAGGKYEEARITFVDGDLSPEGYLLPPRWYEHTMNLNGNWTNFVCPEKTNPGTGEVCPLCLSGDRASIVAGFTIIDHRKFKSQKGTEYSDVRKLFIAKPGTVEMLNKLAVKRGGLAGCTFDVSRTGDKSPSVGNMFDFCEKRPIEELQQTYLWEVVDPKTNAKSKVTYFIPAVYEEETVYRTSEELRKMGLGAPPVPGSSMGNTPPSMDYSKEL